MTCCDNASKVADRIFEATEKMQFFSHLIVGCAETIYDISHG